MHELVLRRLWMRYGDNPGEVVVDCARQGVIPVERCATCERGDGFELGASLGASYVRCSLAPASATRRSSAPAPDWAGLEARTVREVMSSSRLNLRGEATAAYALLAMEREGANSANVVDEDDRPLGTITRDAVRTAEPDARIEALMLPLPFCVRSDDQIARAAGLLMQEGVHHLVVVSDAGKAIGAVTTFDFTRWIRVTAG